MNHSNIDGSYAIIQLFGNYHLQYALHPEHLDRDLESIADCAREYFTINYRIYNTTKEQGQGIRDNFALFQQGKLKLEEIIEHNFDY